MENKKRLIDANSILDDFLKRYTEMERDGKLVFAACEIKQDFADMISNAPTVDAVEVVHGQIEEVEIVPNYMWKYRCSCCHSDAERWYKYCPNCGAKMDLEE